MDLESEQALRELASLGFSGRDVHLAELIPAVEMAWTDGEIHPNERALLEAYCASLVEGLNAQAGAALFTLERALLLLDVLCVRRLTRVERQAALLALKLWSGHGLSGEQMRARMVRWAEAIAVVHGSPVWDARELRWLKIVKRELGAPGEDS